MAGIIYSDKCALIDTKKLEIEECLEFAEKNYSLIEQGMFPVEIIKKIVDSYKEVTNVRRNKAMDDGVDYGC